VVGRRERKKTKRSPSFLRVLLLRRRERCYCRAFLFLLKNGRRKRERGDERKTAFFVFQTLSRRRSLSPSLLSHLLSSFLFLFCANLTTNQREVDVRRGGTLPNTRDDARRERRRTTVLSLRRSTSRRSLFLLSLPTLRLSLSLFDTSSSPSLSDKPRRKGWREAERERKRTLEKSKEREKLCFVCLSFVVYLLSLSPSPPRFSLSFTSSLLSLSVYTLTGLFSFTHVFKIK